MILVALLLAAFLVNLDTTLVNVALPALTRELHATTTQLQWVVDAYNLVFAALLLTFGSLSDRFGRKGMLLAGLAVFGTASLAGGVHDQPGPADRGQGGDGPRRRDDLPGDAVAAHQRLHRAAGARCARSACGARSRAWRSRSGRSSAAGCCGHFSWGSIFFAMAPVAALAAGPAWRVAVPASKDPDAARPDVPGLVLSSATMALLVFTIIEAPAYGWTAAPQPGRLRRLGGAARRVHRGRAARRAPDARRAALPQPAVQRGQRRGHGVVLHPARLHLPDHPVLPVRPRLQRRCRPASACSRSRCRSAIGSVAGHPARGAGRHQAHRHDRAGRDGRVLRLGGGDDERDAELRRHRGADGAVRAGHGPDLGARHRGDHGRHLAGARPGSARPSTTPPGSSAARSASP